MTEIFKIQILLLGFFSTTKIFDAANKYRLELYPQLDKILTAIIATVQK